MNVRKGLSLALKFVVSAALLAYVLSDIPLGQLGSILRDTNPWPFVAALALTPCMIYLTATQTRVLTDLQGLSLTTGQIFAVTFATAFYGLLLPGALVGGAIRWYRFSQQDRKPAEALAAIAFGRLLNTLVLAAVGLVCWALDAEARGTPVYGAILAIAMIGFLGGYMLFFRRRFAEGLVAFLERQALIPGLIRAKLAKLLRAAAEFQSLSAPVVLRMSAVFAIYHVLGIVSFYLLAKALGLQLTFINIGWIRTYILLVTALPISFLGLGVREVTLILVLQTYGILAPAALAYSFLILARTLFTALIGGAIEFAAFLRPARAAARP